MKLIFLDIDGVLNAKGKSASASYSSCLMDGDKIENLNYIVGASGASVVLSSSWRLTAFDEVCQRLAEQGVRVIGKTPVLRGNNRAREILSFLDELDGVEAFVILDDQAVRWGKLQSHLVRTVPTRGLTQANAEKALKILKN